MRSTIFHQNGNLFYSLFEDFIKHLPDHISLPQNGSIGVAGPIQNQEVKITNLGWDIESKKVISTFKNK